LNSVDRNPWTTKTQGYSAETHSYGSYDGYESNYPAQARKFRGEGALVVKGSEWCMILVMVEAWFTSG
jgi:hypothetical protein